MEHPILLQELERLIKKIEDRLCDTVVVNDRIIKDIDYVAIHRVLCELRMLILHITEDKIK